MKRQTFKFLSFIALSAITTQVKAQGWNVNTAGTEVTTQSGVNKVGIGTTSLLDQLNINGNIGFETTYSTPREVYGRSHNFGLSLYSTSSATDGAAIWINGWGNTTAANMRGNIHLKALGPINSTDDALEVTTYDPWASGGGISKSWFRILKNGQTVLGNNVMPNNSTDQLTLDGNIGFNQTYSSPREVYGRSHNYGLSLYSNTNATDGAAIWINGWGNTTAANMRGNIHLKSMGPANSTDNALEVTNYDPWASPSPISTSIFKVFKNGQTVIGKDIVSTPAGYNLFVQNGIHTEAIKATVDVTADGDIISNTGTLKAPFARISDFALIDGALAIGNTSYPSGYKLYVEKGILTEKLRVANSYDPINWADFVFDEGYELMSIPKLEKFIKKNKHLPEIPTTEDVQKNGIDIAEINAKLLQKVEELTLYIIQQQKEIDAIKKNLSHQ